MQIDAISRSAVLKFVGGLHTLKLNNQQMYSAELLDGIMKRVKKLPALDVAPVVRCKSCMKRSTFECPMYSEVDGSDYGLDIIINDRTDDDGFCNEGARMDGEADE